MYESLRDKVVVITGATGGLGPAVVERFHAEGAKVAAVDRSEGKIDELFGALGTVFAVNNIDVTDETSTRHMAQAVINHYGRLDALINIAGGYRAGTPVHETELSTWEFLLNLNAKSVFLASQAVIPHLIAQNSGVIINIGASNGLAGTKNSGAYSVSKSAVFRLTESLAAELKAHNIRVNAVYPITIDTPANRQAMPNADFSKWVTPSSFAGVLAFLASDEARDITSALIPLGAGG